MTSPRIVLYVGPSLLTGEPILAVATDTSSNRKTGDVVSTWILRADVDPMRAIRSGADRAICGDCRHRGTVDPTTGKHGHKRSCYVLPFQAPLAIYRALRRKANGHRPRAADGETIATLGTGREEAAGLGWRTFRVLPYGAPVPNSTHAHEIRCLADRPVPEPMSCDRCRLCDGASRLSRPSILIGAHGTPGANIR